ncbi:hypothetical protein Cal6303_1122 [Calothrix sp. PCC 6303]|nr:hypothetical protein Cal6303_1122 [Calothrix sp. PCC 6303]
MTLRDRIISLRKFYFLTFCVVTEANKANQPRNETAPSHDTGESISIGLINKITLTLIELEMLFQLTSEV